MTPHISGHLTYVSIITADKNKVYYTVCNKEYRPVYVHDITDISNYKHFYSKLFSK